MSTRSRHNPGDTSLDIPQVSDLSTKVLSHWLAAGILLIAGACAPVSQAAVGDPGLGNPQADRVIGFGFGVIKERYLDHVGIGKVAFEAMRGLSVIDPALTVEQTEPRRIAVGYQNEALADYPTPADDDVDGWAALILTVARDASAISPELRNADNEKLYEAVFDSALAKLDMFSRYAGASEAREHRAARNGFGGIGVRYDLNPEDVVLTEVMPDTPAAHAHLQVGDHLTAIDGKALGGLDQKIISNLLRGPIASRVSLTIRHPGAQQAATVGLQRSLIVPQTATMTIDGGIATIAVSSFNQNTAASVTDDVKKAKATPGFKGVVLDLRGNPGGLLDQGVAVADLFMDHGRIVSTRGRNPASVQQYDAKPGDPGEDVPVVVVVDGRSASAAEIVTAALQDSGRAVVVGTNSYGKGTVQTVVRMPNDDEMTLTWSRFYSPSGYPLHGLGVLPSICTADLHADAAALLEPVRDGRSTVAANIASWRATTIGETALRTQLRTACPAGKHTDAGLDLALARDLIEDQTLYAQALGLTAPVSTASSAPIGTAMDQR